jgi:hypothetical protein
METNDASEQLQDVDRLRGATLAESYKGSPLAGVIMAVATIAYFGSYALQPNGFSPWGPLFWTAFCGVWLLMLRRGNRAKPGRISRTTDERRRDALLWAVLFVVANAEVYFLSKISWLLVGIALATLGAVAGVIGNRLSPRT